MLLKIVLLTCSLCVVGFGQASYPSSLASTTTLLQANNNAQTTLSAPLSSVALTLNVSSSATFVLFPTVVTIDFEIIKVCSGTPTTLVVCSSGRGWDGTVATTHIATVVVRGNIIDYYHNQVASEVIAIETFLGINGANIAGKWPSLSLAGNVLTFAANSTVSTPIIINNGSVGATLTTTVPTISSPSGTGNWWIYQAANGTLTLGLQGGLTATSGGAFTQAIISQLPVDAVGLWTGHVTTAVFDAITVTANSLQPIAFGGRSFSAGANVTLVQTGSNVAISASASGATLSRGVFASVPSCTTSQFMYNSTDSALQGFCDGSSNLDWKYKGITVTPTVVADLGTWFNQGSASTVTYPGSWGLIGTSGAATNYHGRVKTPPAPPYSVVACMEGTPGVSNNSSFGMMWTDGTKLVATQIIAVNSISVDKYTNATTYAGSSYLTSTNSVVITGMFCLAMIDDGVNRIEKYSHDKKAWTLLHSVGNTDFLTATGVGIVVADGGAQIPPSVQVVSVETLASAL